MVYKACSHVLSQTPTVEEYYIMPRETHLRFVLRSKIVLETPLKMDNFMPQMEI